MHGQQRRVERPAISNPLRHLGVSGRRSFARLNSDSGRCSNPTPARSLRRTYRQSPVSCRARHNPARHFDPDKILCGGCSHIFASDAAGLGQRRLGCTPGLARP